jgi:hypothetical protein
MHALGPPPYMGRLYVRSSYLFFLIGPKAVNCYGMSPDLATGVTRVKGAIPGRIRYRRRLLHQATFMFIFFPKTPAAAQSVGAHGSTEVVRVMDRRARRGIPTAAALGHCPDGRRPDP